MLLTALQIHFSNNNIQHAQRLSDWSHDVYKNPVNNKQFTIPINELEIPDEFCRIACKWLEIESIEGHPFLNSGSNHNTASA